MSLKQYRAFYSVQCRRIKTQVKKLMSNVFLKNLLIIAISGRLISTHVHTLRASQ